MMRAAVVLALAVAGAEAAVHNDDGWLWRAATVSAGTVRLSPTTLPTPPRPPPTQAAAARATLQSQPSLTPLRRPRLAPTPPPTHTAVPLTRRSGAPRSR